MDVGASRAFGGSPADRLWFRHLRTIAEGIEDEATLQLLRQLGADYAQGFHVGRPASLAMAPAHEPGLVS